MVCDPIVGLPTPQTIWTNWIEHKIVFFWLAVAKDTNCHFKSQNLSYYAKVMNCQSEDESFSLIDRIGLPNTIEPRMVSTFWAHIPILFQSCYSTCFFGAPSQISNLHILIKYNCPIKESDHIPYMYHCPPRPPSSLSWRNKPRHWVVEHVIVSGNRRTTSDKYSKVQHKEITQEV